MYSTERAPQTANAPVGLGNRSALAILIAALIVVALAGAIAIATLGGAGSDSTAKPAGDASQPVQLPPSPAERGQAPELSGPGLRP